jgi:hypothetical protein
MSEMKREKEHPELQSIFLLFVHSNADPTMCYLEV